MCGNRRSEGMGSKDNHSDGDGSRDRQGLSQ